MFPNLRRDLSRYREYSDGEGIIPILTRQGVWAICEYRFSHYVRTELTGPVRVAACFVSAIWHRAIEITTGISISPYARFGPGLYIGHFGQIFVGPITAGENCNLGQGVTIGRHRGGRPTLGDDVHVAAGAKLFGELTIGDGAKIGANAVVTKDVPAGARAFGIPATVHEATPDDVLSAGEAERRRRAEAALEAV